MLKWLGDLFSSPKQPVNTFEEAMMIGQYETQKKFPGDYSSYSAGLLYDSKRNSWRFRYLRNSSEDGVCVLSGIGPGVEIRKSDGKITYINN